MSQQIPFVSRCLPKAKTNAKGDRQFNADMRTAQVRFLDNGGSDNPDNTLSPPSALKVRKIEVINGKKYKVIS
jgi:hypothetical protein